MTRRERLERKIERREEWAAGRRDKAATLRAYGGSLRQDWAFITQPGPIPERARMNRKDEQAAEHAKMAEHHDAKAAGLEAQLERSVFSDDPDAIEQLEARIAEHEAKRDRMRRVNALYKKGDVAGLAALGLDLERLRVKLAAAGPYWGDKPHVAYELTNLGARIRADRERIAAIRARTQRATAAEAAGGVLIEGGEYVRVTFAAPPERAILEALKAAGFQWGGGSWVGPRARLPEAVQEGRS